MKKNNFVNELTKHNIIRFIQFLFGLLVYAIGFNIFLYPNKLVFGDVTGLSILANKLFNIEPFFFILIVSIVLLIVSFIMLGKNKTKISVFGSLLLPFFIKIIELINLDFIFGNENIFLAAIFGGILIGFGTGFVHKNGFTIGGVDIINQIIHKYFKISLGKAMLITNGIIVTSGIFVFGLTKFMYSVIALYLVRLVADKVLLGISNSKAFYIVTRKDQEVRNFILKKLGHGVTIFDAKGGYANNDEDVLFCVIPTDDYFKLKEGIYGIDETAFFVATDAYEVYGGE